MKEKKQKTSGKAGESPLPVWIWGVGGLLAASAFLLYGTLTWHPPDEVRPLKVAIGVWPGSETLIYARETGLLPREEVQLVEMSWSSATKVAFANRVVDAAVVSLDEVLRLLESRNDVRVVMVVGFSKGGDALLTRPGVATLPELKGKRTGVEMNSVGSFVLSTALEEAGMSEGSLETVAMNLAEMETAYLAGELDTVVTGEPWTTRLKAKGAVELFSSRRMNREVCRVLVVREEVLSERPDDIERLVAAHFKARQSLLAGGEAKALTVVKRRLGLSDDDFKVVMSNMDMPDSAENLRLLEGEVPPLGLLADSVAKKMVRQKLLAASPKAEDWMTAECLKE
ncbi:ABC transporter substrate-binding protein [Verrucomicrobium sp. BvORR106]|uniref:ABC transporter substrate-binding protein n=1 Tax=Verrucomicrobium sp. BvORR106 TaxID=1403819 RepID=UPI0005720A9B|nr:ABC transporter substrate-binding protein [Verrucomicrobium sp. BvORR106]